MDLIKMQDLESAIHYLLRFDVAHHKLITGRKINFKIFFGDYLISLYQKNSGEKLIALQTFLAVLAKVNFEK